jgi:hypothetical protein
MTDAVQFAHPDADQLTAFAERALPPHERQGVLAHLAACPVCRQVVFLAQQAEPESLPIIEPVRPKPSWFSGWNLAFAGAAALAAIVALTLHLRTISHPQAPPAAIAKVEAPTPISGSTAAVAPAPPPPKPAPIRPAITLGTPVLTRRQAVEDLPLAGRNIAAIPQPPAVTSPGEIHGSAFRADAPPKPVVLGGLAGMSAGAAQPGRAEPKAVAKMAAGTAVRSNIPALDQVELAKKIPFPPPPPVPVQAPLVQNQYQTGGPSQAAAAPMRQQVSAAPAAAASVNQTVTVSGAADMALDTESNATSLLVSPTNLPGKLPLRSSVSHGHVSVAIDSTGAVFASKDDGRHWKPVAAKWAEPASQVSFDASAKPQVFLLTSGATLWVSKDGRSWKPR